MRRHNISRFCQVNPLTFAAVVFCGLMVVLPARGAYLFEIDTDGVDDGIVTYNSGFSFGGDTTTASQSAAALSYGIVGGDSIFGGDGASFPDTYVYTYSPTSDADNLAIPAGTLLGGTDLATGLTGGGTGVYNVYATWPSTDNVSGGLTNYSVSTAGDGFEVDIDQNGKGNFWVLLGEITFSDPGSSITVTQTAGSNTFVSMRAYGLLFEAVPEPATLTLLGAGLLLMRRRR